MGRVWAMAPALALFAGLMWFVWLGWDHEYYEVDGVPQGPYRPWQVIGCGLAITTGTVLAYLRAPRTAAVFILAIAAVIGFAVPWAVSASSEDDSGLWVVGLVFLLVGGGVGLIVLLAVISAVMGSGRSTARDLGVCVALAVLAALVWLPLAIVPLAGAAWLLLFRWLPDRRRAQR
jgi:hypothetical protein